MTGSEADTVFLGLSPVHSKGSLWTAQIATASRHCQETAAKTRKPIKLALGIINGGNTEDGSARHHNAPANRQPYIGVKHQEGALTTRPVRSIPPRSGPAAHARCYLH